jgi:hypothetical protein
MAAYERYRKAFRQGQEAVGAQNSQLRVHLEISRPAFRGYGMMIANVGLPPGTEVDRGILEEIIGDGDVCSNRGW